MINIDFQNECCGCSACAQACPQCCIDMSENSDGFLIPKINLEKCTDCNLCENACPVFNSEIEVLNDKNIPKNVYAAYNKNEDVRMKSSSGGIFTLLAEYAIKKNGVVFGARLSDDCKSVYHCMIENIDDISFFRGSKYVQSNIKNTYKDVKNQLASGRFVMFSGTPCQIEGLSLFLKRKYENLFLVDFVCMGVPSQKVWHKYIEYVENKYFLLQNIYFRDKSSGWSNSSFKINYQNGKNHIEKLYENLYGSAFQSGLCLRKSCYNCKFRKANHKSDITICDFWGIDETAPEMNDDKGISAIMINSLKGEKAFEDIKCELVYKSVNFYAVERHNSVLKQPAIHKNRERFYRNLDTVDFERNVKKNIARHSILIRVPYKMVKICLKTVLGDGNFYKLKMRVKIFLEKYIGRIKSLYSRKHAP